MSFDNRGTTRMKLWLIEQDDNDGYDTYDSAVVAAETEDAARRTYPNDDDYRWSDEAKMWVGHRKDGSTYAAYDRDWTTPDKVRVRLIGEAVDGTMAGTICASFNAG